MARKSTPARIRKPAAAAAKPSKKKKPPDAPTNPSPLADFCRSLPGTTEDIKWGDNLIFSIGAKIYAGFEVDDPDQLAFKCDEADFDRLTDIDGIIPAPYSARFSWVKVTRRGVLPDAELKCLLRKSYDLVAQKLPARARRELGLNSSEE